MIRGVFTPLFKGFFWSNAFSLVTIGITKYLLVSRDDGAALIFSEFVIVPILMGIIAGWFWHDLRPSTKSLVLKILANTGIAILLSFMFLGEGDICLIIVSPLLF